jgi:hypothetical protein
MARLNIAVDHGQTPKNVRANFERAVLAAQARFSGWVDRLDWSADRTKVTVAGKGFEVDIWYDDQKVYARGTVPLAFKLLEGPFKTFVVQSLAEPS